jgi:hypothetical protein
LLVSCALPADPLAVFILPAADSPWAPEWTDISEEDMPYQYDNMVKSGFLAGAKVWDTPDAIVMNIQTRSRNYFGRYIKSIGRFEPYCGIVACDHQNNECPVGGVFCGLDARDGALYAGRTVRGEKGLFSAYAEPDMGWICRLRGERLVPVAGSFGIEGGIPAAALCGQGGFYVFSGGALLYLPYGSGRPQTLIEDFSRAYSPVIIGEYLYATDFKTLFRVPLAGPDYTPETVAAECVRYSTDGKSLYYNAPQDGRASWFRCGLEGENAALLVQEELSSPAFDGEYMYYIAAAEGRRAVRRLPLSGGAAETIYAGGITPAEVYVLPTCANALLLESSEMEFYFLPKTGGEPLLLDHPNP